MDSVTADVGEGRKDQKSISGAAGMIPIGVC